MCPAIYHYTNVTGLIGIVTRQELWASDCQFLNDGTELKYAREIFSAEVKKLNLPPLEGSSGYMIAGPSLDRFRVFIACFCEEGDLLSQWRSYGADQGYAIGFDTERLQALNSGDIYPVQYGIANPSEYFEKELHWATEPTGHPGNVEWFESEKLLPRLARVKHPSFAEEREWRLLKQIPVFALKGHGVETHYRPSSMGPIAYLVISFTPDCLREIVVGPGSHAETRENAVRTMLQSLGLLNVNVRISAIPFRK